MDSFESGFLLGVIVGSTVVYGAVWLILREAKGPLDQGRDWHADDNQLAVEDER